MPWFRTTKRSRYSTLRAIGREMVTQWPAGTNARNDVQSLASKPGGDAAWPEGGHRRNDSTDQQRLGHFLFGR
jgi:hypothetical protein